MKQISKITNSKAFQIIKSIISLDGEKRFLVSSLTFYLIISSIPMLTLTYYFLKILGIIDLPFFSYISLTDFSFENLFSNNLSLSISAIISIYIASKGILNYYHYINEKFNLKKIPFNFITSKLYSIIITIIVCFFLSIVIALNIYITLNSFFKWILNIFYLFLILLFLNYFLLFKKIDFHYLIPGSLISSLLLNISSFGFNLYLYITSSKEKYYGIFTNMIIILLFFYTLSYIICLGNQINFSFFSIKKGIKRFLN